MTDSSIGVSGTNDRLQTYKRTVNGNDVHAEVVAMGQWVDDANTKTITSTDASPTTEWLGTASRLRTNGVVGVFLSVISSAAVAGYYRFRFGENGTTWPVDIQLHSSDFSTIRFRKLLVVGEYFQAGFIPDTPLGTTQVFVKTEFLTQPGPDFAVPVNHVFEEDEAAFGTHFIFPKAFGYDGLSKNIRSTEQGDLYVHDAQLFVTESGSLDTESVRDDISMSFSRDSGAASIATLVDHSSSGTVTHDSTNGRAVFSTTSTAGRTAYFESPSTAQYEAGHMIRGEQTIEVSPALAGTAKVEWGFGEDDGSGDVLNGIGWGMDATGTYIFRKKAGAYASKVYQTSFNVDLLDGVEPTRFRTSTGAVAYDSTKNTLYSMAYEWLGVAPPQYRIQAPLGEFVTAHIENTSNRITSTTVPEPELPLFVRVSNGNQATNYTVSCGSWRGGIYTSKAIDSTLDTNTTSQVAVTASAALAIDTTGSRKGASLKCMSSSSRALVYGYTSGVTTSTGYELAPGEPADRSWGPGVKVWVIQAGGSGTVTACVDQGS